MDQFNTAFQHGADLCLHNVPNTTASNTGFCGNGIVENGEQCDCGNSASQVLDSGVNSVTVLGFGPLQKCGCEGT